MKRAALWLLLVVALLLPCIWLAEGGRALLLAAMVLALALPLAVKSVRGRLDVLEPIVLANLSLAVMFVGRPLADLVTRQFDHYGYSILPTFDEALFTALAGVIALQLGYVAGIGPACARHFPTPPPFRRGAIAAAGWIYLGLGGLLFGLFLSRHGGAGLLLTLLAGRASTDSALFMSSTGYLYNGILLWGATALLFFALATAGGRRRYLVWFVIVTIPLLVFYGARGTRANLLPLIVAVPAFWYLWRGRRPRVRTLAIAALLGLSVLGWMREVRTAGERGPVVERLGQALMSPAGQAAEILTGADAEMFDSLANALVVVPERLAFQHGAVITDILVRAVPRPWWPEKPLESNDALIATLWPDHYSLSRASPASSLIGSLYLDSGIVTVALGMFLTGAGMAALWAWLRRHRASVLAQLVYCMTLPFVVILLRGTFPDTLARALFLVVPMGLLVAFTRVRLRLLPRRSELA